MSRRDTWLQKSAHRGALLFRTALVTAVLTLLASLLARALGGTATLAAQAVPSLTTTGPAAVATEARVDTLPGQLLVHKLGAGGRLLVYRQPESSLVAIRFSFPLLPEDGPVRAYARMAQWLAGSELERRAGAYGARVELECSYDRASFAITGAARDAADLARSLREALTWGAWTDGDIRTARFAEDAREQQRSETPDPALDGLLAARLFPALPPSADSAPRRVTAAMLRAFWDATFRQDRLQAVVVGRVTDAEALGMMSGWPPVTRVESAAPDTAEAGGGERETPGAPAETTPIPSPSAPPRAVSRRAPRGTAGARQRRPTPNVRAPAPQEPASSVGRPQLLYSWAGMGWPTQADPAAAAVAARLISDRLSPEWLRLARAELWWSAGGRALVAIGSATAPDTSGRPTGGRTSARAGVASDLAPNPAQWLAEAVATARQTVTAEEVEAARLAISREILLSTRTPEGLARYLGEMFERTDQPAGGQTFLRQLGRVDIRGVERALELEGEPVQVELRK